MLPPDLISEARILSGCEVTSKKRLLESFGELLADAVTGVTAEAVFEHLLERERLGSTGLGHGIALPHARMDEVIVPVGALIQLRAGVDFDAIDDRPVDIAFALLVPREADERHLQLLAGLAELFNQAALRQRLRDARDGAELLATLTSWEARAGEQ